MKRALNFASKLNSRDVQKCDCLWVPSYDLLVQSFPLALQMDKFIFMTTTLLAWWEHYRLTLCHVWMLLSTPPCQTVLLVVGGRDKSKSGSNSIVLECIKCTITIHFWLLSKFLLVRYLSVFYSFMFNSQLSMHFIVFLDFLFSREKCFHISLTWDQA